MTRALLSLVLVVGGCCHAQSPLAPASPAPPAAPLELGAIRSPDVAPFVAAVAEAIERRDPVIRIEIDSPGGRVDLGLGIISLLRTAAKRGAVVECHLAPGAMAASMGALIFELGCTHRTMAAGSALLFHEPSLSDVEGTAGDLRRAAHQLDDVGHRLAILVAPKLRLSVSQYEAWVRERDRWVSANEALAMGAVDVVEPLLSP